MTRKTIRDRRARATGGAYTLAAGWQRLEGSGWLSRRSAVTRKHLRGIARIRTMDAGQTLYRVGDAPDGVYGLVSGALEVSIPRIDGQEVIVHRAEPGFWIGDLALFAGQSRLITLRATNGCQVVQLPQERLKPLVEANAELMRDFYELSHENMAMTLRLLGNLAVTGADNRVALRLMVQNASLPTGEQWIRMSQDALAELVALSTQSVRRSIRRLEESGLIETGYGRVRVIDPVALGRLCYYAELPRAPADGSRRLPAGP
ncbi:MAG TPA: Crp/Fnr family transcriptional regulator [Woeseiaceae bacterium]|nr:Crp/Fnr family transcriptional regulator [Woeseiaceae bacterium]